MAAGRKRVEAPAVSSPVVAITYERYSTDRQDCESIDTQRAENRAYIERMGWTYAGSYADDATSGCVRLHRPDYQRLCERLSAGEVDAVVATETSRLSRDPEELQRLWKHLEFHRIQLHCPFDGGAVDDVRLLLSSYRSKEEVKKTRARTRSAQASKVRDGLSAGGVAYGYTVDHERNDPTKRRGCGHLVVVEAEAAIVREIFERYGENNESCRSIARDLDRRGVPPPRSGKRRGAPQWRPSTIAGWRERGTGILNNVRYIGRYRWGELEYAIDPDTEMRVSRPNGVHEKVEVEVPDWRILPQALWDKVKARQAALDDKLERRKAAARDAADTDDRCAKARAGKRPTYVLSGLLRCGCCGGGFAVVGDGRLGCATRANAGREACTNRRTLKRERLEAAVLDGLERDLMHPEAVQAFVEAYNAGVRNGGGAVEKERARLEREAVQVERELSNLMAALRATGSSPTIIAEIGRAEARQRELAERLAALPATPGPMTVHRDAAELYRSRVQEVATLFSDRALAPKVNDLLREVVEAIVVKPGAGKTWRVEVRGSLPGLFRWGRSPTAAALLSGRDRGDLFSSVQMVAGARVDRRLPPISC